MGHPTHDMAKSEKVNKYTPEEWELFKAICKIKSHLPNRFGGPGSSVDFSAERLDQAFISLVNKRRMGEGLDPISEQTQITHQTAGMILAIQQTVGRELCEG